MYLFTLGSSIKEFHHFVSLLKTIVQYRQTPKRI